MQNDDGARSAKNRKTRENLKRYVVVGLLFFAELAVMYIIQNVHGCENAKTAFIGLFTLAVSLVAFFTAVNVCVRRLNEDKK
ncbi:MAG: hypothetical protein IJ027_00040 [Oscillospiraceae bacterium]|nr:hypothetical protein [Oscillospiraceae bacterium]